MIAAHAVEHRAYLAVAIEALMLAGLSTYTEPLAERIAFEHRIKGGMATVAAAPRSALTAISIIRITSTNSSTTCVACAVTAGGVAVAIALAIAIACSCAVSGMFSCRA